MASYRIRCLILLFLKFPTLTFSKNFPYYDLHATLNATQHDELDRPLIELIPSIAKVSRVAIEECYESINDTNSSHGSLFQPNNTLRHVLHEYFSHFNDYSVTAYQIKNLIESLKIIVDHVIKCNTPEKHGANNHKPSFKVGLTSVSDKDIRYITGLNSKHMNKNRVKRELQQGKNEYGNCGSPMTIVEDLPKSYDISKIHPEILENMRNQRRCGSCYAFAVAHCVEGANVMAGNQYKQLSVQYMLDNDMVNKGCAGGTGHDAFNFILENPLPTEKEYPYTGWRRRPYTKELRNLSSIHVDDDRSDYNRSDNDNVFPIGPKNSDNVGISSFCFKYEPTSFEERKQMIHTFGPIWWGGSIGRAFYSYKSGVYEEEACESSDIGHAMSIVGWQKNNLILKNSWGRYWGENGIVKMPADACGSPNQAAYAIVV